MADVNDLIIQAQKGSIEAFEPIVHRFQDMAVGYGYAILHDWQLAEDAAQEAFINAFLDLADLKEPKAFPGWFRRIAFKQIDRISRKHKSIVSLEQAATVKDNQPLPSEIFQKKELQDEVQYAIQSLPLQQREIVTLYYIGEHTYKEIGEFLDLPTTTIKMRLYHARQLLKDKLFLLIEENLPKNRPSSDNTFKEKLMSFQIRTKRIPSQRVLSISRHASMKDLQAHLDGGIKTLTVYALSESKHSHLQDIEIDGSPFAIYHKRESAEDLYIEICLPVKGGIDATKEIEVKELRSANVVFASATLRQSMFPGILKAYEAIEDWFRTTNNQFADQPRETYLNYEHSIFSASANWEDPCLEISWPYQPSS